MPDFSYGDYIYLGRIGDIPKPYCQLLIHKEDPVRTITSPK